MGNSRACVGGCPLGRLLVAKNANSLSIFKVPLSFSKYKVIHCPEDLLTKFATLHILGTHFLMFGKLRICTSSILFSSLKIKNRNQKSPHPILANFKMSAKGCWGCFSFVFFEAAFQIWNAEQFYFTLVGQLNDKCIHVYTNRFLFCVPTYTPFILWDLNYFWWMEQLFSNKVTECGFGLHLHKSCRRDPWLF